jgi:hypothetical protein
VRRPRRGGVMRGGAMREKTRRKQGTKKRHKKIGRSVGVYFRISAPIRNTISDVISLVIRKSVNRADYPTYSFPYDSPYQISI